MSSVIFQRQLMTKATCRLESIIILSGRKATAFDSPRSDPYHLNCDRYTVHRILLDTEQRCRLIDHKKERHTTRSSHCTPYLDIMAISPFAPMHPRRCCFGTVPFVRCDCVIMRSTMV